MIEFKADCGHTVRAKEEDVGGTARCSYCGRYANVPFPQSDDLSFLFRDVKVPPPDEAKRFSLPRLFVRKDGKPRNINIFAIFFRLLYVAVVLTIVVVVAQRFVIPMFDAEVRRDRYAGRAVTDRSIEEPALAERPAGSSERPAVTGTKVRSGLTVRSVPPGARVECWKQQTSGGAGGHRRVASAVSGLGDGEVLTTEAGTYVVEVSFALNDALLMDPRLSQHDKYLAFRRRVENAASEDRTGLVEAFFLPDAASSVRVERRGEQLRLTRRYLGVEVEDGAATVLQALFLPRLISTEDGGFLIAPLLHGYMPTDGAYSFDVQHVRGELSFYGVASEDQSLIMDFLARVGVAPYMTPDRSVRLFKIDPRSGNITARLLGASLP